MGLMAYNGSFQNRDGKWFHFEFFLLEFESYVKNGSEAVSQFSGKEARMDDVWAASCLGREWCPTAFSDIKYDCWQGFQPRVN